VQLNTYQPIRQTVATLTAALLGAGMASAADRGTVESSLLIYSETNRVTATEAVAAVRYNLRGDRKLNLKATFDGLTGASPNGAVPSNQIQTFTRPSGNDSYTVQPGELPLDDTFHDTRFALDGSLSGPLGRLSTYTFGGHFSTEYDYLSLGANAGITRDFNRRNTTLDLSVAYSHDQISPEGGIPIPFASMRPPGLSQPRSGDSDTKTTLDGVVGLTQVLDRKTLFQANYSISHVSGYMTDPFKVLSVVEGPQDTSPGTPIDYLFEKRPDRRTKQAIFARMNRYLAGNVLDASYRYFWDDWSIRSSTVDVFYRQKVWHDHALRPHFRYYHQTAADFYRGYLLQPDATPNYASADLRLAKFDAYTVGLEYSFPVTPLMRASVTGEYYTQRGDLSPPADMGNLASYDLFPDLDVVMVRAGFSYDL